MLSKCAASQWPISVAPKSLVYQYDVDIVFGRPETLDDENATGIKKLTKSNDDQHKKLCQGILETYGTLDGITYTYDKRAILWTTKPLKQDINLTVAQPDLDESLKESFKDPEGVLRVFISKTRHVDLSSLPTKRCTNINEDRTWRTVIEMVLREHPITRKNNPYVSIGAGELYESDYVRFDRGLVYRNGNRKGVQVIESSNGPQLCLSLNFCRKVFFPDNTQNQIIVFTFELKNIIERFKRIEYILFQGWEIWTCFSRGKKSAAEKTAAASADV